MLRRALYSTLCLLAAASAASAKSSGVDFGTAGSIIVARPSGPTEPPGAKGAVSSVSQKRSSFLDSLVSTAGFPCVGVAGVNLCGSSSNDSATATTGTATTPEVADTCPVKNDVTGKYGTIYSVDHSGSTTLPCGGVVSLGTVQSSVVAVPDDLAIVDADGSIRIYSFNKNAGDGGTNFKLAENMVLPKQFCGTTTGTGPDATTKPGDYVPSPTEQWIFFKNSDTQLILRTTEPKSAETEDDTTVTDPSTVPAMSDNEIYQEKFLIVPMKNGKSNFDPDQCVEKDDWYKLRPQTMNDVWFQPSTSAVDCQDEHVSINAGSCTGSLLYMSLDTPALVTQPDQPAIFYSIEGRDELITVTTDTSYVQMQSGSAMRLGGAQGSYVLSEGGYMILTSGNILRMSAPATINAASGTITLTGGGYIETPSGTRTTTITAGTSIKPQAEKPYNVYPNKKIILPYGMLLPTKPSPTLRLPLEVPQ